MLIFGLKPSLALTRQSISKSHHYAIRNVRRAIRTEMANKRRSVNWYQPDFHVSEKSRTKRSFYCFPIKKDIIRQFSAESFQFVTGERKESRAIRELVPSNHIRVTVKKLWMWMWFFCVSNDHHRINLAHVQQLRSTHFPDLFSISCIPRTFGVVHAI